MSPGRIIHLFGFLPGCAFPVYIGYYPPDLTAQCILQLPARESLLDCPTKDSIPARVGFQVPLTPDEEHGVAALYFRLPREYYWLNPPAAVFPKLYGFEATDNTHFPPGREYSFPAPVGIYNYRFDFQLPCGKKIRHNQLIELKSGQTLLLSIQPQIYQIRIEDGG